MITLNCNRTRLSREAFLASDRTSTKADWEWAIYLNEKAFESYTSRCQTKLDHGNWLMKQYSKFINNNKGLATALANCNRTRGLYSEVLHYEDKLKKLQGYIIKDVKLCKS